MEARGFESHLELEFFSEFPFDVKTLSCCYFFKRLVWMVGYERMKKLTIYPTKIFSTFFNMLFGGT